MIRKYEEVRMPIEEGTTLLHPERALLKWEGIRNRSDIGQICYLRRDTSNTQRMPVRSRNTTARSAWCCGALTSCWMNCASATPYWSIRSSRTLILKGIWTLSGRPSSISFTNWEWHEQHADRTDR
ncbi:hypothetical protein [Burkholderia sp. AW49-1]